MRPCGMRLSCPSFLLTHGPEQPLGARPVFRRVDILDAMPGQQHRCRGGAENHFSLQPGLCLPPIELASVMECFFQILGTSSEMLRTEHLDAATRGHTQRPL